MCRSENIVFYKQDHNFDSFVVLSLRFYPVIDMNLTTAHASPKNGGPLHLSVVVLSSVFLFVIFVIGMVGNMLVCLSVYKVKYLRTANNALLVNLAIADLATCVCSVPLVIIIVLVNGQYPTINLTDQMCAAQTFFHTLCSCAQLITLASISMERYYAIAHPFKTKHRKKRVIGGIISAWSLGLLFGFLTASKFRTSPLFLMCKGEAQSYHLYHKSMTSGSYFISPIGGMSLVVIIIFYIRILTTVHKHNKNMDTGISPRTARNKIVPTLKPEVTMTTHVDAPSILIVDRLPSSEVPSKSNAQCSSAPNDVMKLSHENEREGTVFGEANVATFKSNSDVESTGVATEQVRPGKRESRNGLTISLPGFVDNTGNESRTALGEPAIDLRRNETILSPALEMTGALTGVNTCEPSEKIDDVPNTQKISNDIEERRSLDEQVSYQETKTTQQRETSNIEKPNSCPDNELKDTLDVNIVENESDYIGKYTSSSNHGDSFPQVNSSRKQEKGDPNEEVIDCINNATCLEVPVSSSNNISMEKCHSQIGLTDNQVQNSNCPDSVNSNFESVVVKVTRAEESESPPVDVDVTSNLTTQVNMPVSGTLSEASQQFYGSVCVMNTSAKERGKRRVEARTAKRAWYIIGSFVICWMPLPIITMIIAFHGEQLDRSDVLYELEICAYTVAVFGAAMNPVVYALVNKQFRTEFTQILRKCICHCKNS